ncbi:MAG: MlaD family protein [Deltaproteobacteria bacterium]|jgi:phospholipid/cholesterol/gamma-HCH transport system substrate-binding protein/paraquat-inducible protein B|nr:MlaD family protein [Deltaproteobacteria bacterium]
MSHKTNYFKIGVFAVSAFFLAAAATLYFGLSSAFQPLLKCQSYFEHSVQGLSIGASVNFRGFKVGQVSTISIPQILGPSGQQVVSVEYFVYPALLSGRKEASVEQAKNILEKELEKNLRCYLSYQGVSGLGYLDLDYLSLEDSREPIYFVEGQSDRLIIPTARGSILNIGESLSQILRSLRSLNFSQLNDSLNLTLTKISGLADSLGGDTSKLAASLDRSLDSVKAAAEEITVLANLLNSDFKALNLSAQGAELSISIKKLSSVMNQIDSLLLNTRNTLPATMDNLKVMSENFRQLSEQAKRYPSHLLFGEPPKPLR